MSSDSDVPKGKVSCLLCRGFISYKNSDRSRFKDHMLNEHDVKFDSDVILAVSVMSQKEKAFIVKSSLQRLGEISNNQNPSSGESLLPPPPPAHPAPPALVSTPPPSQKPPNPRPGNPRGRPPGGVKPENATPQRMMQQFGPTATSLQTGRPRGPNPGPLSHPQQQMQRQRPGARGASPQISRIAAPVPPPQLPPNFPQHLGVSISRIDPSVKCDMCKIVLPNSGMLAEHMKMEHLSRFSGLVIATPSSDKNNKRQSLPEPDNLSSMLPVRPPPPPQQVPSKRPRTVETPLNFKKLGLGSTGRNVASQNFSPQSNRMVRKVPESKSNPKQTTLPHKSFSSPSQKPVPIPVQPTVSSPVEDVPSPHIQEQTRPDPVIKCNTCGQFVKQSVFKSHKLSHPQGAKQEKEVINVMKDEGRKVSTDLMDSAPKPRRREEKQIDFVDLGDSDDESARSKLPKIVEKSIQCPACEKKLATNMALKMHMNMKHPVKSEVVDTEELVAEESDEQAKEGTQDKIRDEVESMETLELLDNLVNFLNDT